jgi:hypothetical protein
MLSSENICNVHTCRLSSRYSVEPCFHLKTFFWLRIRTLVSRLKAVWGYTIDISWVDCPLHGFYLWRHVLSTAPPFILWRWKFEILLNPLLRSSSYTGALITNSNGTQSAHKGKRWGEDSLDTILVSMGYTCRRDVRVEQGYHSTLVDISLGVSGHV